MSNYCGRYYDPWSKRCRECKYPCTAESKKRAHDKLHEAAEYSREYTRYCDKLDKNWQ